MLFQNSNGIPYFIDSMFSTINANTIYLILLLKFHIITNKIDTGQPTVYYGNAKKYPQKK